MPEHRERGAPRLEGSGSTRPRSESSPRTCGAAARRSFRAEARPRRRSRTAHRLQGGRGRRVRGLPGERRPPPPDRRGQGQGQGAARGARVANPRRRPWRWATAPRAARPRPSCAQSLKEAGPGRAGGPGQRGRRQRLQRERRRARGVSRPRPDGARRDLDRPAAPGSAGRAREDRPQEHRRRPVPARRRPAGPWSGASTRWSTPASTRSASTSTPPRRHLLAHVSGIGPALAKAIVEHRAGAGPLPVARASSLDVPRFSAKTFEQAAGFLRIPGAEHPLDNTGVHPERYARARGPGRALGKPVAELLGPGAALVRQASATSRRGRGLHLRRHREGAREAGPRSARRASCPSRSATTFTSSRT